MQTTNQTTNRASLRGRGGPAAAASSEVNHDQARLRESIVSQCHELRTALTTLKVSSSHGGRSTTNCSKQYVVFDTG
jgi:hypothetical protein